MWQQHWKWIGATSPRRPGQRFVLVWKGRSSRRRIWYWTQSVAAGFAHRFEDDVAKQRLRRPVFLEGENDDIRAWVACHEPFHLDRDRLIRAILLAKRSRFLREGDRWYYLDGDIS
jgi:hypothetical protein